MGILIACERRGIVREAFRAQGHNAVSCDLLPTEIPGPHIQEDVRLHLKGWDMIIAFPPCTYLTWARNGHYTDPLDIEDAVNFVKQIWNAPADYICIENPPGRLSHAWRSPDHLIRAYHFGDPYFKVHHLWLKNLPPLMNTYICEKYECIHQKGDKANRDIIFPGIADAMASQWSYLTLPMKVVS